jgi:hypothetical protein
MLARDVYLSREAGSWHALISTRVPKCFLLGRLRAQGLGCAVEEIQVLKDVLRPGGCDYALLRWNKDIIGEELQARLSRL